MAGNRVTSEPIHGMECRGGVARSTTKARANGNAFRQREVNREAVSDCFQDRGGGLHGKILPGRPKVRPLDVDRHPAALAPLGSERIGQTNQTE
jgi:hypothetical protein